jgi:hypothetical protein
VHVVGGLSHPYGGKLPLSLMSIMGSGSLPPQWDDTSVQQLPTAVYRAATSFPVSCLTPIEGLHDQIIRFLPSHYDALRLVKNFYDHFGLMYAISSFRALAVAILNPTLVASSPRGLS